ncbi:MAG: hypothetical protein M3P98_04340 [bacterium]|nr:hypothetical protein [bacterium]
MSKEILALDKDEVFFPFIATFIDDHNREFGTEASTVQASYDFEDFLEISRDEVIKRVHDFTFKGHVGVEPVEGAIDGIHRLNDRFDLVVVTARHPMFRPQSEEWIETHFPGVFSELHLIGFPDTNEHHRPKVEVCQEIGAIGLIDDSLSNVTSVAEAGLQGVLFGDYGWNQTEILPSGVIRVRDWQEVAEHFGV